MFILSAESRRILATGTSLSYPTDGRFNLPSRGTLIHVTVTSSVVSQGPCFANLVAEINEIIHSLKNGWIRGPSLFGRAGALVWNGEIDLKKDSFVGLHLRNDTGSSVDWTLTWEVRDV